MLSWSFPNNLKYSVTSPPFNPTPAFTASNDVFKLEPEVALFASEPVPDCVVELSFELFKFNTTFGQETCYSTKIASAWQNDHLPFAIHDML